MSKSLADQLRKAIKESGLSMYRMSAETGMNGPTLIRFMNGDRDLTLGRADLLCDYFGVEFSKPKYPKGRTHGD